MGALDVTALLQAAKAGEPAATERLFSLLYSDLKDLAHAQLAGSRRHGQTLQTTALVHEAYLRLAARSALAADDRAHFFNLVARVMRHVVIDFARRRASQKRGAALRVPWPEGFDPPAAEAVEGPTVLALDTALSRLELASPRLSQLVELRFFAGLGLTEIGELLGLSERTLKRDWRRARAFLLAELS
jgi:RNA polymerase sigma factor (TIGR02999 family)